MIHDSKFENILTRPRFLMASVIAGIFLLAVGWKSFGEKEVAKSPVPISTSSQVLGGNVSASCHAAGGLPDPVCTPGATNPDVSQDTIDLTICVRGYTKTVRPPVEYTNKLKLEIMAKYGLIDSPSNYELDHLIPLELGGNSTSEHNLWPEAYSSTPGAHEKDKVENYLNEQVCWGKISLQVAQSQIVTNWLAVYQKIARGD